MPFYWRVCRISQTQKDLLLWTNTACLYGSTVSHPSALPSVLHLPWRICETVRAPSCLGASRDLNWHVLGMWGSLASPSRVLWRICSSACPKGHSEGVIFTLQKLGFVRNYLVPAYFSKEVCVHFSCNSKHPSQLATYLRADLLWPSGSHAKISAFKSIISSLQDSQEEPVQFGFHLLFWEFCGLFFPEGSFCMVSWPKQRPCWWSQIFWWKILFLGVVLISFYRSS